MNVGLLGAGHIARALAEGWRRAPAGRGPGPVLHVYDPQASSSAALAADFDARACASPAELVAACDVVILAMRPPDVAAALAEVAPALQRRGLVSLAAAVPLDDLRAGLAPGAAVARVMPNVAAAIGRGVFLFVVGTLSAEQVAAVRALFELAGTVVEVPESLFDAATAVAGCGPGFTALFIEALAEAGVAHGLDETMARALAIAAVAGSADLVAREGDPVAVRTAIATPGGMTAEGVDVLEARGTRAALTAAVAAAIARARQTA
jgi:pyrroline-5-carboxylate reductase